jgi:hypothetical protein
MTHLKCLAAASILVLSATAAFACPSYGEFTMAAAPEEATTAQSEPAQTAPVQEATAPAATEVAAAPPAETTAQR